MGPWAEAGDSAQRGMRGALCVVALSLVSTSQRRSPAVQGGGEGKKFCQAAAIETAEWSRIPAKHRRGKGNWRMGRGEPRRAGEEKVKVKKTIRNIISLLCQILWDFLSQAFCQPAGSQNC